MAARRGCVLLDPKGFRIFWIFLDPEVFVSFGSKRFSYLLDPKVFVSFGSKRFSYLFFPPFRHSPLIRGVDVTDRNRNTSSSSINCLQFLLPVLGVPLALACVILSLALSPHPNERREPTSTMTRYQISNPPSLHPISPHA